MKVFSKKKHIIIIILALITCNLFSQTFTEKELEIVALENGSISCADYDNDGDIDLALTGRLGDYTTGVNKSMIYRNDGNNTYTDINAGLEGLPYDSRSKECQWADIDNDMDLDLLLGYIIYRNDGNDTFTKLNIAFEGKYGRFCDYNNDGKIDIAMSGNYLTILYRNEGSYLFQKSTNEFIGINDGSMEWLDYDNDGYFDLLCSGQNSSGNKYSKIYRNNGDESFSEVDVGLMDFLHSKATIGDYDCDGDLDIFLTGALNTLETKFLIFNNTSGFFKETKAFLTSPSWVKNVETGDFNNDGSLDFITLSNNNLYLFTNDGFNTFSEIILISKDVLFSCEFSSADYDKDGDLDVIIIGTNYSKVLLNEISLINSPPVKPINLISRVKNSSVNLKWSKTMDDITQKNGLSYNLSVGTFKNSDNIFSSNSNLVNGQRKTSGLGNTQLDTTLTISNLPPGKYYWKVQAIDNSYQGSTFSEIDSFEIKLAFDKIATIDISPGDDIAWGDYDNDNDLDILGIRVLNLDGKSYCTPVIYNNAGDGKFNEISIPEALNPRFDEMGGYVFAGDATWGDYDNDGDLDVLLSNKILKNLGSDEFVISNYIIGGHKFGDYDNDGDLDVLSNTSLYINRGNDIFVNSSFYSGNTIYGFFADFDNDMDLDLILSKGKWKGALSKNPTSIFRNNMASYIEVPNLNLPELEFGCKSINVLDADNDRRLDLIFAGKQSDYYNIGKLFHNDGSFIFNLLNDKFLGAGGASSVTSGDYDNDGDLEIIYNGHNDISANTRLYDYTSAGLYKEIKTNLPNSYNGLLSFGDFDNDADLDLIIGANIFRNNGYWPNDPPSAPTNLHSEKKGYSIFLGWNPSIDNQGGNTGLTYNIRVGNKIGGQDKMAPMSDIVTGYRRIPEMGNVQTNIGWRLDSLPEGTYYWSVQAIDQSFMGGAWAPEQTFTISVVRADFSADTVCFGQLTQFIDQSLTSGTSLTEWKWDFSDGTSSTDQNPSHTFAAPGEFAVKLIALSSDYSDTLIKTVTVLPKPSASFSVDPVCHGKSTVFVNSSGTNGLAISSWDWDFGDGQSFSDQNPPEHFFAQPGNYKTKLTITASNGCIDTLTKFSKVGEYPVVILTADGPTEICAGNTVTLSVGNQSNYSYQWNLNELPLTDAKNSSLLVNTTGSYSVNVTNTVANCLSASPKTDVSVVEKPAAPLIIYDGITNGFCPSEESLTINLDQPSSSYSYQWKRNGIPIDNATGSSYTGEQKAGIYSVAASVKGCATESNEITLTPKETYPKPDIYVKGPVVWYMAASENKATGYIWYRDNEIIPGADKYIYVANQTLGTYKVAITNEFGCTTISDEVTIPVLKSEMKGFDVPAEFLPDDLDPFAGLKIYPNPTPGLFTIEMDNDVFGELNISIATQNGKEILKIKFQKSTEHFLTQVDLSGQPNGMYIINLLIDRYKATRKLLVE